MIRTYRKKPVEIEAIQFVGSNANEVLAWVTKFSLEDQVEWLPSGNLVVHTIEGDMTAIPGDWIIKGIKGEFYPCKPDIFSDLYDLVETDQDWVLPEDYAEAAQ